MPTDASYNLRGKRIVFTRTNLSPLSNTLSEYELASEGAVSGEIRIYAGYDSGIGGIHGISINIAPAEGSGESTIMWDENIGWAKTEYTYPNDQDYLVVHNNLPMSSDNVWGFNYVYVVE